jgi:putative DNA primase/helicase
MRYDEKAEVIAKGRWPEILAAAGMSSAFFTGRHGPCPNCGGRDRYQWSNKYDGVWVCRKCTEGSYRSPMDLLMLHMGYTFTQAADHVRDYIKGNGYSVRQREAFAAAAAADRREDREYQLRKMTRIWEATQDMQAGDPVDLYLRYRVPGLKFRPRMIRFHPGLEYWQAPDDPKGKPQLLGEFPAMVAKAFDTQGNFVQLHKTFLTLNGRKADVPRAKKMEVGVGAASFAVPLMQVTGDTLGFAEGIESALGAAMWGVPVWPCLTGPSLAAFEMPAKLLGHVRRAVIFKDHDELKQVRTKQGERWRSAGNEYALKLGARLRAQGLRVLYVTPAKVGDDMADFWDKQRQLAAA